MLFPPPSGTDRVQGLAARLGCTVAVHCEPYGRPKAAVMGSFSSLAMTLKEFGGRWDKTERVYVFANWPTLEAALAYCVAHRDDACVRTPAATHPAIGHREAYEEMNMEVLQKM